jgi:hypothetical protein
VKLGSNGIEDIIEVSLTGDEREAFKKSADSVRSLVRAMNGLVKKQEKKAALEVKNGTRNKTGTVSQEKRANGAALPD